MYYIWNIAFIERYCFLCSKKNIEQIYRNTCLQSLFRNYWENRHFVKLIEQYFKQSTYELSATSKVRRLGLDYLTVIFYDYGSIALRWRIPSPHRRMPYNVCVHCAVSIIYHSGNYATMINRQIMDSWCIHYWYVCLHLQNQPFICMDYGDIWHYM